MADNRSQVKKDDICQKMAGNGFPRVSRRGHRGDQEDHSRKWLKMAKKDFRGYMVGNGFPRVSRRGHRGDQAGNGRKWLKMAGNGRKWSKKSSPRLFGRKWISAYYTPFPYYLITTTIKNQIHPI